MQDNTGQHCPWINHEWRDRCVISVCMRKTLTRLDKESRGTPLHSPAQGGFSQWCFGRELSRCAQIFTNAQYSHALQLPALLISQEVASNLEAAGGTTQAASPRWRSSLAKVSIASDLCTCSRCKEDQLVTNGQSRFQPSASRSHFAP